MKASEIAGAIVTDLFHFRRNLIVSNVAWGMLPWEADLLVMSNAGYVSEIEIKTSIADLKRDPKKRKFLHPYMIERAATLLKHRWYAMPVAVWEHKAAAACVPEDAGVIVVLDAEGYRPDLNTGWMGVKIERQAATNPAALPLTHEQRFQLARLGVMRHWARLSREDRKRMKALRERERTEFVDSLAPKEGSTP